MGEVRIPRKVLNTRFHRKKPVRRPRKRWGDAVDEDEKKEILQVRFWRRMADERREWGEDIEGRQGPTRAVVT